MSSLESIRKFLTLALFASILAGIFSRDVMPQNDRPRAHDIGLKIGILPIGKLNAITDVTGVAVGQTTLMRGENVRTGVTVVLPHNGNLFREKVPGAVFVGNGFGKLMGSTQVEELGEIETPILLTSTLSVPRAVKLLSNDAMSPLFLATIEATEEAVYNSLFRATTVTGRENRTVEALPLEKTLTILRKYGKIK